MTSSGYRYLIERILHRTETVNIPVEQPTRFYLTITPKTAKAIGVAIPHSLLLRTHAVVE